MIYTRCQSWWPLEKPVAAGGFTRYGADAVTWVTPGQLLSAPVVGLTLAARDEYGSSKSDHVAGLTRCHNDKRPAA